MKIIKVEDAVGSILSHDVTKIVPNEFKGRLFKKGHIIKEEDIDKLREIGKDHVYVWEPKEGEVHENDAALTIYDMCKAVDKRMVIESTYLLKKTGGKSGEFNF